MGSAVAGMDLARLHAARFKGSGGGLAGFGWNEVRWVGFEGAG